MKITILDTQTGIRRQVDKPFDAFWWAEGNGSCDCNRSRFMEVDTGKPQGWCQGSLRFLIVAADEDSYTLREYNADYPDAILEAHLPKEKTL